MFKSTLGGHHVSLGKPKACTAKQPSEVCPFYDLTCVAAMAAEGSKWDGLEQRVLQGIDVNLDVLRLQSTVVHLDAMLRRSHDKLRNCKNWVVTAALRSCDWERSCFLVWRHRIANGATFEFSSTGWYKVRDTPIKRIKRCLTWGRTKYGSTTVLQPPWWQQVKIVFRLIGIKMPQVSKFTKYVKWYHVNYVNEHHVNVLCFTM